MNNSTPHQPIKKTPPSGKKCCKYLLKDLACIALLCGLIFGAFLGNRTLSVPEEARYAEIPREMVATHDYTIPRINGVKYFEKPPLFYWMQAGSIQLFGLHNWALRLSTALMGLLGVLATYLFTRNLYGRKTAWFAVIILASMPLYFSMSRVITLDMTVSTWIIISLFSCYSAIRANANNSRRYLMWLAFISAAAAVLTKGLIGLLIPCGIFGLWFLIFNQWHQLKKLFLPSSILLFIIITVPWHLLAQLKAPEFLRFYLLDQQLFRYTTLISHRYQPWYFYISVVLLGAAPWVWLCFLPSNIKQLTKLKWTNRHNHQDEYFLLLCVSFIFIFFSCSHSKLIPYVVPLLAPLAILIALTIKSIKKLVITAAIVLIVLFTGYLKTDYFSRDSIKPLARTLLSIKKPEDIVIAFQHYYQDLPFYLQQKVVVFQGFNELRFGTQHEDTSSWMLKQQNQLALLWNSNKTVYIIIDKRRYEQFKKIYPNHPGKILAQVKADYLIVNHQNIEKSNQGKTI